jgi:hypothetical protein
VIPREEGEGLLNYLDRLTLMAEERASLQVRFEAISQELATATMAERQLARYLLLIETDLSNDATSGIEASKPESEISASTVISLMQSAYSKFNDEAIPTQSGPAAQQEIPPENTPAITPVEPANSEINSETTEDYVPDTERIRIWALAQTCDFTAADASQVLGITEKSCGNYLGQILKSSNLERIEGTGKAGIPSRYRISGAIAPAQAEEPKEEPIHLDRSRLPLDQRLLLEHLEKNGPMSQKLACAQLNWANSRADRAINELTRGGLLGRLGGLLKAIPPEVMAAD